MTTVFYPGMGVDIVTPLLCCDKVYKIYATGPLDEGKFAKNVLQKSILFMQNLVNCGSNDFYIKDDDEFIQFLPIDSEAETIKKVQFKTRGLYYMQFKYFGRTVTLYYYYKARVEDDKWNVPEQVDYIIHKDCDWDIEKDKAKLAKIVKPTTQVIANKHDLRVTWKFSKKFVKKLKQIEVQKKMIEESEAEDIIEPLYCVEKKWDE